MRLRIGDAKIADLRRRGWRAGSVGAGGRLDGEVVGAVDQRGGGDLGVIDADQRQNDRAVADIIVDAGDDRQMPDLRERRGLRKAVRIGDHDVVGDDSGFAAECHMKMRDRDPPADRGGGAGIDDRDKPVPVPEQHEQDNGQNQRAEDVGPDAAPAACGYGCGDTCAHRAGNACPGRRVPGRRSRPDGVRQVTPGGLGGPARSLHTS